MLANNRGAPPTRLNSASLAATMRTFADFVFDRFAMAHTVPRFAVVIAMGLLLGAFHHMFVYPSLFHGDSASTQVLASAMIEEKSFIPRDFYYGNQLILWRSSPFIAFALMLGASGYNAFAIGSTISVAFWFFVIYVLLSHFYLGNPRSLFFTSLLFVPISYFDNDFLVGQQSHLANIALSLAILTLTYACLSQPRLRYSLLLAAAVCAMAVESPSRALLVLVPLMAVLVCLSPIKRALRVGIVLCAAFMLGFGTNQLLVRKLDLSIQRDVGSGAELRFRSFDQIVDGFKSVSLDAMNGVSNLDSFASVPVHAGQLVVYGIMWMWCFYFAWTTFVAARWTMRATSKALVSLHRSALSPRLFVNATAVSFLIVGMMAAACFNPESARHFYFALLFLKLLALEKAYRALRKLMGGRYMAGLALVVLVTVISSFTVLYVVSDRKPDRLSRPITSRTFTALSAAMEQYNTRWIFGADFWKMFPLNVYIPNARSTELVNFKNGLSVRHWLSRPSSTCARGVVLYYLAENNDTDRMIAARVAAEGGTMVARVDGKQIWAGKPVWVIDRLC